MSACRILWAGVLFSLTLSNVSAVRADSPPTAPLPAGLVLWLDASDTASVKTDADGKVILWRDRSGQSHDVAAGEEVSTRPQLVPDALNNRPVIRFSGGQILRCQTPLRTSSGEVTVIVVSRRTMSQSGGNAWQRLFSSQPDAGQGDHLSPNFVLTGDSQGLPSAYAPVITETEQSNVPIGPLGIGGGADGGSNGLRGDIAEVLVYNRAFLAQGDRLLVLEYLRTKWKAAIPQSLLDWTRVGGLGPTPRHLRADLPLSDQKNHGHWRLDKQVSDEFDTAFNTQRWHLSPTSPGDWAGRQPALYVPSNVTVNHGMLQVAFRKGDVPEMKNYPGQGYAGYTSGSVRTTKRTGYGYYEICAKPMNSAGSSAFWFTDTGVSDNATEIDVFEIGGKTQYFNRKYNMNAHVWATPQEKRHWSIGGVWDSPWNLADDFHIYGFDWNKDHLTWYVDGVTVRQAKNTNWFLPMYLIFDSEAMWDWFGKVDDADLPSFFQVKYLRVWRQGPRGR